MKNESLTSTLEHLSSSISCYSWNRFFILIFESEKDAKNNRPYYKKSNLYKYVHKKTLKVPPYKDSLIRSYIVVMDTYTYTIVRMQVLTQVTYRIMPYYIRLYHIPDYAECYGDQLQMYKNNIH